MFYDPFQHTSEQDECQSSPERNIGRETSDARDRRKSRSDADSLVLPSAWYYWRLADRTSSGLLREKHHALAGRSSKRQRRRQTRRSDRSRHRRRHRNPDHRADRHVSGCRSPAGGQPDPEQPAGRARTRRVPPFPATPPKKSGKISFRSFWPTPKTFGTISSENMNKAVRQTQARALPRRSAIRAAAAPARPSGRFTARPTKRSTSTSASFRS